MRLLKSKVPPNIDIGCQSLLIYFIVLQKGIWEKTLSLEYPFLPFIGVLEFIPKSFFFYATISIFITAIPSLFVGYRIRFFSLIMGLYFLLIILSSKPIYSTNLVFATCLFILIGLSTASKNWVFRIQISILYFGAAINKALSLDWWNGKFYLNFSSIFEMPLFEILASITDRVLLAKTFGVGTIAIEIALGMLFLLPRTKIYGIYLGLFFHIGMLILTKGELSFIYLYVMFTAYILSLNTSVGKINALCPKTTLFFILKKIDVFKTIHWTFDSKNKIHVRYGNHEYFNRKAVIVLLIHQRIVFYLIPIGMVAYDKFSYILMKLISLT